MVPFVVSSLLFNHDCTFPYIRKGGVGSCHLDFLSSWFSSGFVWCFFCRGGGRGVYVCNFFFLRVISICSYLIQIYELILVFCVFCGVTKDNIPGELRMFSIPFLSSSEHFFLSLVCLY